MNTLAIFFGLLLSVGIGENPAPRDTSVAAIRIDDMSDIGRLLLSSPGFNEAWKYYPGDNPAWADPEFDDSSWYNIPPGRLRADEMPDVLWPGYGWWRLRFRTDSALSQKELSLRYFGWGAADVYLNGELINTFGQVSTIPDHEVTYYPYHNYYKPIEIRPGEVHTLAVRYSFHQAKRNQQLFGVHATDLGFDIHYITPEFIDLRTSEIKYVVFTVSFTGGILLILLLIHFILFVKFPDDRSNLFIALVIFCLLVSSINGFIHFLYYTNPLSFGLSSYAVNLFGAFPFFIFPYIIAVLFRLKKYYRVIHFTWGYLIYIPLFHFGWFIEQALFFVLLSSFLLCGFLLRKAASGTIHGVRYIAGGILGTIVLLCIYILMDTQILNFSLLLFYILLTLIYTFIPFGLTLFIANRYGSLFGSMEKLVKQRTRELEASMDNLQATQEQLIQQEKLASLGQLTAGIAHEIKNPLNFVNNFSELSVELIEEWRQEIKDKRLKIAGRPSEDKVANSDEDTYGSIADLIDDIEANLNKIHEHGSRADSIVKSMLEHSRGGSGIKEPADINALLREYVNLSFHGMRAGKDPINVHIEFETDDSLPQIPLITEDFSRVVVNLCNNAFDAMRVKLNSNREASNSNEYQPKLIIRTIAGKEEEEKVTIEIEDNGPGIPDEIKDKILQPFFTTKKGTEGTGLGLSITNDIIKSHGGSLSLESEPGEGTTFTIVLNRQ